jgi:hypothetical protein
MANEIYHRSNWGNAVNDKYWADVYEKYSATNKMYIRSDYYENSNETDKLMADIYPKPSILLTPTAYDNGSLHSVKPVKTFGNELVTNGNFEYNVNGWSTDSGATLTWQSDQTCLVATTADTTFAITQGNILTSNIKYKVSLRFKPNNTGTFRVRLGGSSVSFSTTSFNINQWNYIEFEAVADNHIFEAGSQGGSITQFYIDNVSVKEVIDADFDFTRGSSATRVNEKGLIEDVQILSGNLVQNGDFSQIGSELVTNGDFATDSDWTLVGDVSISNGVCTFFDTGSNTNSRLIQSTITANKTYKLVFRVTRYVEGGIQVIFGGAPAKSLDISAGVGTYTVYLTAGNSIQWEIKRWGLFPAFDFDIDNISVKEVGQNWNTTNPWTINNLGAYYDDTSSNRLQQNNLNLVANKTYKLTFDIEITTVNQAYIWIGNGGGSVNYTGTNYQFYPTGSHTVYFQMPSNQTTLGFYGSQTGGAFYMNNISLIEITEDTDLPRINYTNFDYENGEVVPYSGTGSLLLEPQSTNLVTYSEDFSQWNRVNNVTLTTDITVKNPDGTDSTKLTKDSSSVSIVSDDGISILASTTYVFSFFVKKGNYDIVKAEVGSGSNNVNVSYTFSTDSFSTSESGTQTLISVDSSSFENDWKRISIVFTGTITSLNATLFILNSVNDYVYYFGAQLEELSYATSYIPTNGEVNGVTRLADVCNNAGSSDLISSTEGVLYAEISALNNDGTSRQISLSDGSNANNKISLRYTSTTNELNAFVKSGGSVVFDESEILSDTTQNNKLALKYKQNDFSLYVNGVEVATDTNGNTPTGLNVLDFDSAIGTLNFYGNVKTVAVFKEALDNDQLERLTGEGYESFNLLAQANNYTII